MGIIKSFTDFEQSKKLTEILPLESADMHHKVDRFKNDYRTLIIPYSELGFFKDADDEYCVPCWSLAALIDVLPKIYNLKPILDLEENSILYSGIEIYVHADNPIDACYQMVLKLHENKML